MEAANLDINEIKKYLYKSKTFANLHCYIKGAVYYTVQLENGLYQFPIYVTEPLIKKDTKKYYISDKVFRESPLINDEEEAAEFEKLRANDYPHLDVLLTDDLRKAILVETSELKCLSEDLSATTFSAQVKASELIRWISKAIDKMEFVKIGNLQ